MWKDFKAFVLRGNVLDLAVGLIIGGAFGGIVQSLVRDIIMPPIGLILGRVDFTNLFLPLDGNAYASLAAAQEVGAPTLNYGLFINTIINFIIVAFAIFMLIRWFNSLKKAPAPVDAATKACPHCTLDIPIKATRCPQCTSEL
ncbi:MAG TPA: large conductance mechanosensitive channel protein MscL [Levilinea sp.]|nr:large conductance mechanosensitive channel protein MscL [Levilinea sp.]